MSFDRGCFYEIRGIDPDGFEVTEQSVANGLTVYALTFSSKEPMGDLSFTLRFPMIGYLSTYTPTIYYDAQLHQWFNPTRTSSNFYAGAPVISAVADGERNAATVTLSDAVNDCNFSLYVNDFAEREHVEIKVGLLTGRVRKDKYTVFLRVDTRPVAIAEALREVSRWWAEYYPMREPVPEAAADALYSSWYNFHQHPNAELLEKELELASGMGFKTVILDDGWQYDGNGAGNYSECGDWQVSMEKFPDFKGFADKVHGLGMKLMLWFTVPFVGKDAARFSEFTDRALYMNPDALVLDPRYASVREFIIGNLTDFVRTYGLDGLKLDFIDSFRIKDETPPANDRMDHPDLSDAVICLLEELEAALKAIRPGLLLEYRQNYVGPAINRFGNMLRVGDCAFSSQVNRSNLADLRMLNYDTRIHADMLYWARGERPEACARQLLDILFGVPQISVLLTQSTEEQKKVISSFLTYWTANRSALLDGEFTVHGQDKGYTALESENDEKRIVALYAQTTCILDGRPTDIFNAGIDNAIHVYAGRGGRTAATLDCFGETTNTKVLRAGWNVCHVPMGGHLEIR